MKSINLRSRGGVMSVLPYVLIALVASSACTVDNERDETPLASSTTTSTPAAATPADSPTSTPTPVPTAAAQVPLPVAPEGRTGVPAIDQVIDGLLSDSLEDVRTAARGRAATSPPCPPNPDVFLPAPITIAFESWAEDLVQSERRLFAVVRGTDRISPDNIEVVLEVGEGAEALYWRLTLADSEHGQVVKVHIPCSRSDGWGPPREMSAYLVGPPKAVWDSGHSATTPERPWNEVLEDAVGPLVVYSYNVRLERYPEHPWESFWTKAVVTYDVGASREIARFELSDRDLRTTIIGLAGSELVLKQSPLPSRDFRAPIHPPSTVVVYDLNGETPRMLGDTLSASWSHHISPDGSMLAGVGSEETCGGPLPCVAVIELATGEVVAVVPRAAIGPDAFRTPEPQVWRDDGRGIVAEGQPNGHRMFGVYTVMLDGSTQDHAITDLGSLAPGGRYFLGILDDFSPWDDPDAFGCVLFQTARVHDLETDAIILTTQEDGFALRSTFRWSPDGTELLYAVSDVPTTTDEPCSTAWAKWLAQPTYWRLLDVERRTITPIDAPEPVLERWVEELDAPRVAFRCGTEEHLLHPIQNGSWYPLSSCLDDQGEEAPVQFEIDGVEVNSFEPESEPTVIGVIRLGD